MCQTILGFSNEYPLNNRKIKWNISFDTMVTSMRSPLHLVEKYQEACKKTENIVSCFK